MSIQIQLRSSPVQKEVAVHVLPCHIAYDGSAKVSQHFRPRTDPIDKSFSTSSLRGRKLCGKLICLPKNYSGHVFYPTDSVPQFDRINYGDDEDDEVLEKTTWESGEKFDSLTIWEHHALPDEKQDNWIRGIEEWVAMANAMNSAGYDTKDRDNSENSHISTGPMN